MVWAILIAQVETMDSVRSLLLYSDGINHNKERIHEIVR